SAVKGEKFICPVPKGNYMDMMYMPDAIDACINLMEADPKKFIHRNSFNIASMSFTPPMLYEALKKRVPTLEMEYVDDPIRAAISASWPNKLDDTCAREEWGWKPKWDMNSMIDDMLIKIKAKLNK
ncbi:MAG: L-threonine 3-dehydrogenase, partial [Rikenellaceae bacterium]